MKHKATAIRKLFISILSTLLLAMSLTTSTYAWFQINSTGTVSGFDFTAISGLGFKVSIDDKVYTNDLSSDQIKMAILNSYNPEKYRITTVINSDNQFEQYLETDDTKYVNNKPVTEVVRLTSEQLTSEVKKKVQLLPLTSKSGIVLKDLYNSESHSDTGRFLSFSVYFKQEAEDDADNIIDIYLSGKDRTEMNGNVVGGTVIKSDTGYVKLLTKMETYDRTYVRNDSITVSSVNALRYSVEDVSKTQKVRDANPTLTDAELEEQGLIEAPIFEPTDEYNLGSYATDYGNRGIAEDNDSNLLKLYNSKTNASFTYYNNLKPFSTLTALNYDSKPKTVTTLLDSEGNDRTDIQPLVSLVPGDGVKKLTFRFWLEGWDADCFDGLANSISVKLSFRSAYRKLQNDGE